MGIMLFDIYGRYRSFLLRICLYQYLFYAITNSPYVMGLEYLLLSCFMSLWTFNDRYELTHVEFLLVLVDRKEILKTVQKKYIKRC